MLTVWCLLLDIHVFLNFLLKFSSIYIYKRNIGTGIYSSGEILKNKQKKQSIVTDNFDLERTENFLFSEIYFLKLQRYDLYFSFIV